MTVAATAAFGLTVVQTAIALAGSLLVTGIVGGARVHAVAASLQAARDADLERVASAVAATEKSLIWTAEELCRGKVPPLPKEPDLEETGVLGTVLAAVGNLKVQGVAAQLRVHNESQAAVLVTMHQTLARRQHTLIAGMLEHLTLLQDSIEDPHLLHRIFRIDHLATRLRRLVESVAIVLGGKSLRQPRNAALVSNVLRGAKSEVVKYERVLTASADVGAAFALPAHVHPDVTHLLAELIDNGLDSSDPNSKVIVRAQKVAKGIVIEVEDRALLVMDPIKRARLNELLCDPNPVDIAEQVRTGNLGLIVAAKTAAKYGLEVWLSVNPTGGTTANVVVPNHYLVPAAPVIGTVSVPAVRESVRTPGRESERTADREPPPPPVPAAASAPPPESAGSGGLDPLPKRRREPIPAASPKQEPAVATQAANPRTAASWRRNLRAGLQADRPPTHDSPQSSTS
ncbi:ATP-binding protein [Streptomyces sp. NPDC047072]|uniref:ATP-binding protein n=1 Tax=Streptomyces sp. NPDC047072 TaxID=3154809 RepID=UPI0033CE9080